MTLCLGLIVVKSIGIGYYVIVYLFNVASMNLAVCVSVVVAFVNTTCCFLSTAAASPLQTVPGDIACKCSLLNRMKLA